MLPEVFVMAHIECSRETETAIFDARTNLPVLDFQTWQVWITGLSFAVIQCLTKVAIMHCRNYNEKGSSRVCL